MNTTGKIIVAATVGAAIGAVIGILFAPGKGSETRNKIRDESKKFTDEVKDAVSKGKEKLSLKEDIEQIIREKAERFV